MHEEDFISISFKDFWLVFSHLENDNCILYSSVIVWIFVSSYKNITKLHLAKMLNLGYLGNIFA